MPKRDPATDVRCRSRRLLRIATPNVAEPIRRLCDTTRQGARRRRTASFGEALGPRFRGKRGRWGAPFAPAAIAAGALQLAVLYEAARLIAQADSLDELVA